VDRFRTFPALLPGLCGGGGGGGGGEGGGSEGDCGAGASRGSGGSGGATGGGGEVMARIVGDCKAVFSARAVKKKGQYSEGNTFWLAADAAPR